MSRVLLTWELGANLGHLAQLLPIAKRLKEERHKVYGATKNVTAAAMILGAAKMPFMQVPLAPAIRGGVNVRKTDDTDTLILSVWADGTKLSAMVQAWVTLLPLFDPKRIPNAVTLYFLLYRLIYFENNYESLKIKNVYYFYILFSKFISIILGRMPCHRRAILKHWISNKNRK